MTTGRSLKPNEIPFLRCPAWIDIKAMADSFSSSTADFNHPSWTEPMVRAYWMSIGTLLLAISVDRDTDVEVLSLREKLLALGVLNQANNGLFFTAVADVRAYLEAADARRSNLTLVN